MTQDAEESGKSGELAGASEAEAEGSEHDESDEPAQTPFDHPLFLPVILAGLSLWFFYDGFIETDPDMLEHLSFNRGGFGVLAALTAWFGWKGLREMREITAEAEKRARNENGRPPPIG